MLKCVVLFALIAAVIAAQLPKTRSSKTNPFGSRFPLGPPPLALMKMKEFFKNEPRACNPLFLVKANECANVPMVVTPKKIEECAKELKAKAKSQTTASPTRQKRQLAGDSTGQVQAANSPSVDSPIAFSGGQGGFPGELPTGSPFGQGGGPLGGFPFGQGGGFLGGPGGFPGAGLGPQQRAALSRFADPLCTTECALSKGNFLTSDGNLDLAALNKSYVDAAKSETWKTIAADAVNSCYKDVTTNAASYATDFEEKDKKCKDLALRFLTCTQKTLLLNAPEGETLNSQKSPEAGGLALPPMPTASCTDRVKQLKGCDHNYVYKMKKSEMRSAKKSGANVFAGENKSNKAPRVNKNKLFAPKRKSSTTAPPAA